MISWVISSSVLIAFVLFVRLIFRQRISPRFQYALWLLVALRLLIPVNFGQSAASVMNYVPQQLEATVTSQSSKAFETQPIASPSKTSQSLETKSSDSQIEIAPTNENNTVIATDTVHIDMAQLWKTVYIIGIFVTLLCLISSNLRFYLRLRRSRCTEGEYKSLPVYSVPWLETPCMFGLMHPSIYLLPNLDREQANHTLRHEYGHVRQGDHIWAVVRAACLVLHWYNPLVWAAALLSKRDGELACDQLVTGDLNPSERLNYGRTLVSLSCQRRDNVLCTATTMSLKGKTLTHRVEYIAHKPKMLISTLVTVMLVAALAAGCTFTGASENTPQPTVMPETAASEQGRIVDRNGETLSADAISQYSDISDFAEQYTKQGYELALTIDSKLQAAANQALSENLGENGSGIAVVVDVNTGEPLAIASIGQASYYTTSYTYQPNSLFLPVTATAVLSGYITSIDEKIDCTGSFTQYESDGVVASCTNVHDGENLTDAIRDDCLNYFYTVGNVTGVDAINEYAISYGLGQCTGIEIPETTGNLVDRSDKAWRIGNTLDVVVGREDNRFTALQYAEYCAAVANRGVRYSASILSKLTDSSGQVQYTRENQVLSLTPQETVRNAWLALSDENNMWDSYWTALHQGMYERINLNYSDIWQSCAWETVGINDGGLFMGFAPYDEPQIAVFVSADMSVNQTDAQTIARDIINACAQLYS